jgi:hypothetical protein
VTKGTVRFTLAANPVGMVLGEPGP